MLVCPTPRNRLPLLRIGLTIRYIVKKVAHPLDFASRYLCPPPPSQTLTFYILKCFINAFLSFRFVLIGTIFLTYNNSYHCNDENLLKIYLFVLTGIHICLVIVEVVIVMISARGTISNSEPRKNIHIPLYIQLALFVLAFAWDVVGVVWIFDPSIDCHKSHSVLLLARSILIWNMMMSTSVGMYLFLRIGTYLIKFT